MSKNGTKISTISLVTTILILITAILFTGIPLTGAQTYDLDKETYAFLGAIPNPVGVNQQVLLHIGITEALGNQEEGWEDITVTVTKPDGAIETLGPFKTDSTGGTGTLFVPDMVGTYRFQTHFPAQTYTWTKRTIFHPQLFQKTVLYKASNSEITELVVQEDPLPYYSDHPLPGEFWTRPVDAQLRDWYKIAGSWLDNPPNLYAPYNEYAPETGHILWAKPLTTGGVAGGITGQHAMGEGDAYEGKFQGSLIVNGILYFKNRFFGVLVIRTENIRII